MYAREPSSTVGDCLGAAETQFSSPNHVLGILEYTHRWRQLGSNDEGDVQCVLPVPLGWSSRTTGGSIDDFGVTRVLASFSPQHDRARPWVSVSSTRMKYEIDPAWWVARRWRRAGSTVEVMRVLDDRWHHRFEVGALRPRAGDAEVLRCTGFVDGEHFIRVDVGAPRARWPGLHALTWPCGALLALTKPTYRREIEGRGGIGNDLVRFDLPASWEGTLSRPPWVDTCRWVVTPRGENHCSATIYVSAAVMAGDQSGSVDARHLRVRHELWFDDITVRGRFRRMSTRMAAVSRPWRLFVGVGECAAERLTILVGHRDFSGIGMDCVAVVRRPDAHDLALLRAAGAMSVILETATSGSSGRGGLGPAWCEW